MSQPPKATAAVSAPVAVPTPAKVPATIDVKAAAARAVVEKRETEKRAAKAAADGRERILVSVVPLRNGSDRRTAARIDEAFKDDHAIRFQLQDPEPAAQQHTVAGFEERIEHLTGSKALPTHKTVKNGDGSTDVVPITREEALLEHMKASFARAYEQAGMTLADLLPYRVVAAWRITRELARLKGQIADDEELGNALSPTRTNEDPWQVPEVWTPEATSGRRGIGYYPELIETFRDANVLDEKFQVHIWVHDEYDRPEKRAFQGFAFMPPPVPPCWRSEFDEVTPDYTPENDPMLGLFMSAVSDVANRLGIPAGSIDQPDRGRLGLYGLLDPQLVRVAWPTKMQLITMESLLVQETLDLLIGQNTSYAKKVLFEKYGLNTHEVSALLRMANALAQEQVSGDREDARSIMVLRLEDFIRRSVDSLDLKAELAGLKQLSIVQGLGDANFNDPMKDFINAVRLVGSERPERTDGLPAKYVENTAGRLTPPVIEGEVTHG